MWRSLTLLVLTPLLLACGASEPADSRSGTAAEIAAVRAAIDSTNRATAVAQLRRDPEGYANALADDGVVMGLDGTDIVGREALAEALRRTWLRADSSRTLLLAEWHADTIEVHGDHAYEVGRGTFVRQDKQLPQAVPDTVHTRYITFWRRQSDGTWRATRDFGANIVRQ